MLSHMKKNKTRERRDISKYSLIGIIAVFILWLFIPSIIILCFDGVESAGELGDTFGIVNALFSSLAFALLIYTSLMQREELELQRKELKLTRRELKKSAEAQNMLVALTKEELELQKEIRRSQIKPELKIEETKWIPITQGFYFELKLKTKYHKLRITKVSISDNDHFVIEENSLKQIVDKYYEDEYEISILLSTKEKKTEQPEGFNITIVYQDIDLHKYEQRIKFEKDYYIISNPKEVSFEGFNYSI